MPVTNQSNSKPPKANPTTPAPGIDMPRRLIDIMVSFWIAYLIFSMLSASQVAVLPYSEFLTLLKSGQVSQVVINDKQITGTYSGGKLAGKQFATYRVDPALGDLLSTAKVKFSAVPSDNFMNGIFGWVTSAIVFFLIISIIAYRFRGADGGLGQGMGGGGLLSSIEKNRARVYAEEKIGTTFADVAGVDEAKEELREVVNFLKEPESYRKLGGRLPKGILLVGPPGTGKTLLARAVAGEAGVPFFSISGSEFVELFVGVGAARVRDLFNQARQKAPCIVFIDELDALGRSRAGTSVIGTHDEKEQTLNQLLVELDGFDPSTGVVLLAATNRPEILDEALLRAGRFDRHVVVDRPDKKGRVEILNVHLKKVVLDSDIDVAELAALTPGFTGADLANVVNEAALLAARRKADKVSKRDFEEAVERTVAGLEKKTRLLNPKERSMVAYHELGHALVALCLPNSEKVQKVSIIPRGIAALGYTVQRPLEDRFILSKTELENKLASLLGGRAAESLIFGEESTGAADDLIKATELARSMITRYGMNEELGLVAYDQGQNTFAGQAAQEFRTNNISQQTAREIDCAIKNLLERAFGRAKEVLTQNRQWLENAAGALLHDETLDEAALWRLKPALAKPAMQITQHAARYS